MQESNIKRYADEKGKNRLKVFGIDFGYGDSNPYIIKETEKFILCRTKGRNYWSSRSQTGYANPEFQIYEKNGHDEVKNTLTKETFEYSRENKKEVYAKALQRLEELQYKSGKPKRMIVRSFNVWKKEVRNANNYHNTIVVKEEKERIDSDIKRLRERIAYLKENRRKIKRMKLDISESAYNDYLAKNQKYADGEKLVLAVDDEAMRGVENG